MLRSLMKASLFSRLDRRQRLTYSTPQTEVVTEPSTGSVIDADLDRRPPDHLVKVLDGEWAFWRCVCLRSAGFPASRALELATSDCAIAADRILIAEAEAEYARQEALREVNRLLDGLRLKGEWGDKAKCAPWVTVLHALKAGKPPKQVGGGASINVRIEA